MVEHHVANVIVAGSIPVTRSNSIDSAGASVAQLVEHHVANVIVAGSIPVTRSIFLKNGFEFERYQHDSFERG